MDTVLSQYSSTGFYKAPVSKGLMGGLFITCTAINVPLLVHLRKHLEFRMPDMLTSPLVYRLLSSRLAFTDTKDVVCSALLIYYFRIFERRFGSRKFASHLLVSWAVSTLLELLVVWASMRWRIGWHPTGLLPPGPYGLIFPLFVDYFLDVPRVVSTRIMGVPVTGKTITFLVGLQICGTSPATVVSALCGIVAGLLCRWNAVRLSRVRVPSCLARLADCTLGRLLASTPPDEGLMGATLDIQRQQQLDSLERQMMAHRFRDVRRHQQDGPGRLFGPVDGRFEAAGFNVQQQQAPDPVSEDSVRHLVEMGFSRERVEEALLSANNDMNLATTLLLRQA